MTSESLVPLTKTDEYLVRNLEREMKAAEVFIKSGFLPKGIDTVSKVLVISEVARALQIPRMQALSSISVINGKPTMEAQLMRALIFRSYPDATFNILENSNKICRIEMARPGGKPQEFSFSMEDAKLAQLDQKDVWKKYPKALMLARATTIGARILFPDVLMGVVYTPEELGEDKILIEEGGEVTRIDEEPRTPQNNTEGHEPPIPQDDGVIDAEVEDIPEEPEGVPISDAQKVQLARYLKSHITSQKERDNIEALDYDKDGEKATAYLTHLFRKQALFKWYEEREVNVLMLKGDNDGVTKKELLVDVKADATDKFANATTNEIVKALGVSVKQDDTGKWVVTPNAK